jgi:hypothetical protein
MGMASSVPILHRVLAWVAFFLLLVPVTAGAAFGFQLDGTLDKNAISKAYFEGDFHRILPPLEAWRSSRADKTREDSIFVYKYLSVIYAADSTTRIKAESYMVQLLKLMPTIELVDMYISDNIEAIFKDVQDKFLKQQQYVRNHDELGRPIGDSLPTHNQSQSEPLRSSRKAQWVWWTVGGVGLAAVATATYFVMNENPGSDPRIDKVKP